MTIYHLSGTGYFIIVDDEVCGYIGYGGGYKPHEEMSKKERLESMKQDVERLVDGSWGPPIYTDE